VREFALQREAAMTKHTIRLVAALFLLSSGVWTAGCAPTFPRETLDRVDRHISFKELQADPEKFKGAWVMFGGVVIASKNIKEGTVIEILHKPLDSDGRPLDTDATEGRFMVQTDQFLDPAVYHQGRLITVIGEVAGSKTMPIDEVTYSYPLLFPKAVHLWRPYSGPRFFFGLGVSGRI
jgi:outer membrane lipoprotein